MLLCAILYVGQRSILYFDIYIYIYSIKAEIQSNRERHYVLKFRLDVLYITD